MEKNQKPKREMKYFLTVFKIEGHQTWRASLSSDKNGFKDTVEEHAKVTEKKTIIVDRITGEFKEEN